MFSVVSICEDNHKTDEFSRKLIKSDQSIWWGLHIWQESYEPSGFVDSVKEDVNPYQHWLDVLRDQGLQEVIEVPEI